MLIVTLAVIYTPGAYRFARALAVNINTMDFITVARARGESTLYLIRSEILPNISARCWPISACASSSSCCCSPASPSSVSACSRRIADWGALVRENIGGLPFGAPAVIVALARDRQPHDQRQPADRQPAPEDPRPERLMTNLVEIRDLKVEATTDAGRPVEIIKGVSLDVADGEIVALIGESGSGKTTIALTLMGYARPGCRITGGAVRVAGKDMARLSENASARKSAAPRSPTCRKVPPPPSTRRRRSWSR